MLVSVSCCLHLKLDFFPPHFFLQCVCSTYFTCSCWRAFFCWFSPTYLLIFWPWFLLLISSYWYLPCWFLSANISLPTYIFLLILIFIPDFFLLTSLFSLACLFPHSFSCWSPPDFLLLSYICYLRPPYSPDSLLLTFILLLTLYWLLPAHSSLLAQSCFLASFSLRPSNSFLLAFPSDIFLTTFLCWPPSYL